MWVCYRVSIEESEYQNAHSHTADSDVLNALAMAAMRSFDMEALFVLVGEAVSSRKDKGPMVGRGAGAADGVGTGGNGSGCAISATATAFV